MSRLADLGWWLVWAAVVPMAAYVVLARLFPPRLRRCRWPAPEPVKVTAIRVWPAPGELPAARREIEP